MEAAPDVDLDAVLASIPVYVPVGGRSQGRVSSMAQGPDGVVTKIVVDFGWDAESVDLEIATRRWDGAAPLGEREIRGFCAERDFMERQMRGAVDTRPLPLPEESTWSIHEAELNEETHSFTALTTPFSWVMAAALHNSFLVRIFATSPQPALTALRRVDSATDLKPLRGVG